MIILRHVSKSFGGVTARKTVLDDVSACFESGRSYVIFGERGAGKGTLLRLLCGTMRPTRGHVERRGAISLPVGQAHLVASQKTLRELYVRGGGGLAVMPAGCSFACSTCDCV